MLHLGSESLLADLAAASGAAAADVLCATGLDRAGRVDLAALALGPREGLVLAL